MNVDNLLLNKLSSIVEIRRFSDDLKKNKNSSLVLTGPVAPGYFIAALSLTNKLVVVSQDAFGLYHESLGVKQLLFDYIPADDKIDIVPKIFNKNVSSRIQSYPFTGQKTSPNVIYTEHDLKSHVAINGSSNGGLVDSLVVGENINIGKLIKTLNERGYIESQEAKFYGEYAHRGGIIDVFPPNTNNPVRIELYGDNVSSVRFYNPTSQLSLNEAEQIYIPDLSPPLKTVKTITYEKSLLDNGYVILHVNTNRERDNENICFLNSCTLIG